MSRKLLLVILGLLLLVAIFILPLFIPVSVICKSQYGDCPEELSSKLEGPKGNLGAQRKHVARQLSGSLLVSDYSMQYKIPGSLIVNILVVKPQFAIFSKSSQKFGLIDSGGKILSIVETSSLPQVATQGEIYQGNSVGPKELFALKLVSGVYDMYQVGKGEMDAEDLVIELPPAVKVIFPLEGDEKVLLGSLRLIYSRIQTDQDLAKYSEIDLRFKNPVLR